jgi:hypothetical protein
MQEENSTDAAPMSEERKAQAAALMSFSFEQLKELVEGAVMAARKPTPEEEEKLEQEKKRRAALQEEMIKVAKAAEEGRDRLQRVCPHRKQNGDSRVVGQIHSDGLIHPICQWCQKQFQPYPPTKDMLAQGVM